MIDYIANVNRYEEPLTYYLKTIPTEAWMYQNNMQLCNSVSISANRLPTIALCNCQERNFENIKEFHSSLGSTSKLWMTQLIK